MLSQKNTQQIINEIKHKDGFKIEELKVRVWFKKILQFFLCFFGLEVKCLINEWSKIWYLHANIFFW